MEALSYWVFQRTHCLYKSSLKNVLVLSSPSTTFWVMITWTKFVSSKTLVKFKHVGLHSNIILIKLKYKMVKLIQQIQTKQKLTKEIK